MLKVSSSFANAWSQAGRNLLKILGMGQVTLFASLVRCCFWRRSRGPLLCGHSVFSWIGKSLSVRNLANRRRTENFLLQRSLTPKSWYVRVCKRSKDNRPKGRKRGGVQKGYNTAEIDWQYVRPTSIQVGGWLAICWPVTLDNVIGPTLAQNVVQPILFDDIEPTLGQFSYAGWVMIFDVSIIFYVLDQLNNKVVSICLHWHWGLEPIRHCGRTSLAPWQILCRAPGCQRFYCILASKEKFSVGLWCKILSSR